jgi:hypothetical protein
MAYMIRLKCDYCWVPDGTGGTMLGQRQGDFPGYGAVTAGVGGYGTVPGAQEASDFVGELVPGGDAPINTNFQTALNAAAADLYTQLTTAGAVPGFTSGTLLALLQAWATGNP